MLARCAKDIFSVCNNPAHPDVNFYCCEKNVQTCSHRGSWAAASREDGEKLTKFKEARKKAHSPAATGKIKKAR